MRSQTREIVLVGYAHPYIILVCVNLCLTKNTFLKILSRFVQWFRKGRLQIFNSLLYIQFATVPQQRFLCKLRLGLSHYYVNLNMRGWVSHVLRGGLWNQIIASCFSQEQVYRHPSLRIITNTMFIFLFRVVQLFMQRNRSVFLIVGLLLTRDKDQWRKLSTW